MWVKGGRHEMASPAGRRECNGYQLRGFGFEEPADGLKIVLQGEHHGPELLEEILGAVELDGEPDRGELDTGGQPGEAGADQLQRSAVGDHPDVLGARRGEQLGQAVFEALAAAQLPAAGLARVQVRQRRHQLLARADEGVARALGSAALAQDPPGDGFRDAKDLLQGLAVDPGGGQLFQNRNSVGKSMKIGGPSGHI